MKLTAIEIQQLIMEYKTGSSSVSLSRKYNISTAAVLGLLKRRGVDRRTTSDALRRCRLSVDFFDEIRSEAQAYALGLLYADGYNNTHKGCVVLQLQARDRQILDDLTTLIQPNKRLQFIDRGYDRARNPRAQDAYRMVIQNRHISDRLSELGCGNNKTFDIKFPMWLDQRLISHFIRGYFDGDGSIAPRHGGSVFAIIGNKAFIEPLQNILIVKCSLTPTRLSLRFKHLPDIVSVRYCGTTQLRRIRDYLYRDAIIFLKRKFERFMLV